MQQTQSLCPTKNENIDSSSSSSSSSSKVGSAYHTTVVSSAESAEKDGKAFHPMISIMEIIIAMRIIPCLLRIVSSLTYQKINGDHGGAASRFHVKFEIYRCSMCYKHVSNMMMLENVHLFLILL
jgi:hypothetical protein